MKKNLIIAAASLFFITQAAQAHIEAGTYVGTTADGKDCQLKSIRDYFENNMPHPLNERIVVQVTHGDYQAEYTVGHPPVVDVEKSMAAFNHDVFHGVMPTRTGATALVIDMNHEEGQEGPVSYSWIDHAWRANTRTKVECKGLKLQGQR